MSSVARRWATLPRLEPTIPPQQTTLKIEKSFPFIPPYIGPSVQKRDPSSCPTWRPSPSPRLPLTSTLLTTLPVPIIGDRKLPRLFQFPPSPPPQTAQITTTNPIPVPTNFRPPLRCQMSLYNNSLTSPSSLLRSATGQPQMLPLNLLFDPLRLPISNQSETLNHLMSPTPSSSPSSQRRFVARSPLV